MSIVPIGFLHKELRRLVGDEEIIGLPKRRRIVSKPVAKVVLPTIEIFAQEENVNTVVGTEISFVSALTVLAEFRQLEITTGLDLPVIPVDIRTGLQAVNVNIKLNVGGISTDFRLNHPDVVYGTELNTGNLEAIASIEEHSALASFDINLFPLETEAGVQQAGITIGTTIVTPDTVVLTEDLELFVITNDGFDFPSFRIESYPEIEIEYGHEVSAPSVDAEVFLDENVVQYGTELGLVSTEAEFLASLRFVGIVNPSSTKYIHSGRSTEPIIIFGVTGDHFKLNKSAHSWRRGNSVHTVHLASNVKPVVLTVDAAFTPINKPHDLEAKEFHYKHHAGWLEVWNHDPISGLLIMDPEDTTEITVEYFDTDDFIVSNVYPPK